MKKKIFRAFLILFVIIFVGIAAPFSVLKIKDKFMDSDYEYLLNEPAYNLSIDNVNLVTQEISCGYAVIEMLTEFYGSKITEEELSEKNDGKITTSTTRGFLKELRSNLPDMNFIKKINLTNTNLLKEVYHSILIGHPVVVEWAAQYAGSWTLHYSLVTGINLNANNITVYNPYGFIENITIKEFINRTSFKAYDKMPLFIKFGFAYGAFDKNTIIFLY